MWLYQPIELVLKKYGTLPRHYIAWREKLPYIMIQIELNNRFRTERGLFLHDHVIIYMDYNSNYISHYTKQEARRLLKVNKL